MRRKRTGRGNGIKKIIKCVRKKKGRLDSPKWFFSLVLCFKSSNSLTNFWHCRDEQILPSSRYAKKRGQKNGRLKILRKTVFFTYFIRIWFEVVGKKGSLADDFSYCENERLASASESSLSPSCFPPVRRLPPRRPHCLPPLFFPSSPPPLPCSPVLLCILPPPLLCLTLVLLCVATPPLPCILPCPLPPTPLLSWGTPPKRGVRCTNRLYFDVKK